jgi:hypothetical protein
MKRSVFIITIAAAIATLPLTGCARQKQAPQPVPEPTKEFVALRNLLLTTPPDKFGFIRTGSGVEAYGILMELGLREHVATLSSFRDGNASFYQGSGGGFLGGGTVDEIRKAAIQFVKEAEPYAEKMKPTDTFPYPDIGRVRFFLLTFDGVLSAEVDERDLANDKNELSPLYAAAHRVLTQFRLADKRGAFKKSADQSNH